MKTIKQLEQEIEKLRKQAKLLEEKDIYSGDLVRIHSKIDKLEPPLTQTKAIAEMIEKRCNELSYPQGEDNVYLELTEILTKINGTT